MRPIILKGWTSLLWTNRIFATNSIFVSFKRENNIRHCFIRSKLYRDNNTVEAPGTTSCHRPRCNTCSHVAIGNTIRGPLRNWNVLGSNTCISSNVIYAITCTRCKKFILGKKVDWQIDSLNTFVQSKSIQLVYRLGHISIHRNIPFLTLRYLL